MLIRSVAILGISFLVAGAGVVRAQEAKTAAAPIVLTAEEIQEKELRKACKVSLCSAFHVKKPETGDVSCSVLKTWRKEQLDKMMSRGKLSWPWGNARCTTDLKFKRATLIKAMAGPEVVADFDKHQITCEFDRDKDKYTVKVDMQPKVTFKDGKAVKATLNWGKIDAPMLAKSALWSATAADNTFGVLQNTVVDDINDFIGPKCLEVKDEWQK